MADWTRTGFADVAAIVPRLRKSISTASCGRWLRCDTDAPPTNLPRP